jgi:hypothetical protein
VTPSPTPPPSGAQPPFTAALMLDLDTEGPSRQLSDVREYRTDSPVFPVRSWPDGHWLARVCPSVMPDERRSPWRLLMPALCVFEINICGGGIPLVLKTYYLGDCLVM